MLFACRPTGPPSNEYRQTCTCFVERRKTKRKERQGAIVHVSAEIMGGGGVERGLNQNKEERMGLFLYYFTLICTINTIHAFVYRYIMTKNNFVSAFKGTESQAFFSSGFFMNQFPPSQRIPLRPFCGGSYLVM